jgi:threonine synthase
MLATMMECLRCGATHGLNEKVIVCRECGGLLDIKYDLERVKQTLSKAELRSRTRSVWRYREFLPIGHAESIVSLGEGLTPLKKTDHYGSSVGSYDLSMKLDFLNPTGSFKDRGTTVTVSQLKELKVGGAMDDSSGNAGASLAAYCAAAQIACTLYVPAGAPGEKLLQAEIFGARVVKVPGSRTDVANAAEEAWKKTGVYYASHNLSPFFFEGMKTLAYEIAEELDWRVPDHVVFPVGGGALMAGAWKGFEELKLLGWADRIPRLHCIQSEACMPITGAFLKGSATVAPVVEKETVAGGIRISNPARGDQVLQALRSTFGRAASVTDEEILRHQSLLARKEGIFAEPTSCAALAGLEKLLKMNVIQDHESVLVPLTGSGLKDTKTATKAAAQHN